MVFGSFAGLLNLVIFLLLVTLIASLVAVQLLRGDIPEGDTMTFSQTYNSFLGMYQVSCSQLLPVLALMAGLFVGELDRCALWICKFAH
jgi:hypothetical protein